MSTGQEETGVGGRPPKIARSLQRERTEPSRGRQQIFIPWPTTHMQEGRVCMLMYSWGCDEYVSEFQENYWLCISSAYIWSTIFPDGVQVRRIYGPAPGVRAALNKPYLLCNLTWVTEFDSACQDILAMCMIKNTYILLYTECAFLGKVRLQDKWYKLSETPPQVK